ncbi:hypothetical protein ACFSMW_18835 [Virgibacillus halophilus]|uniref:Uncharacterized protein n=1 Tax=Tigheibacillus halophilus TaxID=361280 RepID=A0ABU5C1P8_9BACI|nr:hypothetical protein [Virgibacillus halophilus]
MDHKNVSDLEAIIKQHENIILQLIQMTAANNHHISELSAAVRHKSS